MSGHSSAAKTPGGGAAHFVGTSGWSYREWRGIFYPRELPSRSWLDHYMTQFRSVEINATFYRLQKAATLASWAQRTPKGFLFAIKGPRLITHFHKLKNAAHRFPRFYESIAPLGRKAGPILWQLPLGFVADAARLDSFIASLPLGFRYAFEFRDPSWHNDGIYRLLERRRAAFCPFEIGKLTGPRVVTADFVYVRLHGWKGRYKGRYDTDTLKDWARWLRGQTKAGRQVYCYFDNTADADDAVANARELDTLLRR